MTGLRNGLAVLALAVALTVAPPAAAQQAWDAAPWLADLDEMRVALDAKYANLDWLLEEREFPLDRAFRQSADALRRAGSDAAARQVFERIVERMGDGHVSLTWPASAQPDPAASAGTAAPVGFADAGALCKAAGYARRGLDGGVARALPGYRALDGTDFAAGLVQTDSAAIGVIRIGEFDPHGFLPLCEAAAAELREPLDRACDENCADRLLTRSYRLLTAGLANTLARLKREGADVLLVDLSRNGGGSEWAEAAARTLTARPLTAARVAFMKGAHWEKQWGALADTLRGHARRARGAERAQLLGWAAEAEAARVSAAAPCAGAQAGCERLGRAGYATGLVGQATAGAFAGKPWASEVFSIAQYDYRAGAWGGPLVVLVDGETWSAAEEVAAELQDNRAAVILGGRTGGAGCGHTWGGTPTTLSHSRAVLELPDCVRLRADGSNEVRGVIPDVLTGAGGRDGVRLAARLTAAKLGEAVARARALAAER